MSSRSWRRPAVTVLGLLLLPTLGACSTPVAKPAATPSASASRPAPTGPTETLPSSVEERLDDLVTEIEQDRDDTDIPGYAGLSVDAEHATLDLWWVGEPPERVRRVVSGPGGGLTVRLHPARYDVAAMVRAVDDLMDAYPVIHTGSPESDGSGVEVDTTAKGRHSLPSAARLAEQAGMPVHVLLSEPPEPA